jgi:tricorn protease
LRSPFEPTDELQPAPPKEPKKDDKAADILPVNLPEIDLDGIATRLIELPIPAGNYNRLTATAKFLFYTAKAVGFETKPRLLRLDISNKDPKPKLLAEDVKAWEISANHQRVMIRIADKFHVVPVEIEAPAKLEKSVNLSDWAFSLDPREEWRQIYVESWRMLRDYFYDPKMHGVDWPAIRKKYEPLVERVSDRSELNDILHEMAGELAALHIFVRGGELRDGPDQIKPSSLGARLIKDAAAGGWRIDHIFQADPDYPGELSPLAKTGVNVKEGDIILSINGERTQDFAHPNQQLRRLANQSVLLEVKSPADAAPRSVLVKPLSAEAAQDLRYSEWEYTRRLEVEKLGEGKIGYVHLRAMGTENIAEWARDFYPVFNRQGLIIDVRHNKGGNIDSWIMEKLMRKAWFYWSRRVGNPTWNMHYAFRGHVVVLCNERTASDGEAFSDGFRRLGLGKVIGTRTWGGEIWLSAEKWLVDQGMCTAAESGVYGPDGTWLIEGHGVDPDLVVDNLPRATFLGKDAQMEAAVKHLQELIAKDPRPVPPIPAKPDKSMKLGQ